MRQLAVAALALALAVVACGDPFAASSTTASGGTTSSSGTSTGAGGVGQGGAASGGHGGAGGSSTSNNTCAAATDCPPAASACASATCTAGHCGFADAPAGTVLAPSAQKPGDCLERRCDGAGHAVDAPDDADVPLASEACRVWTCSGGHPVATPKPATTPCDGQRLCDSAGSCVECVEGGPACAGGGSCQNGVCVAQSCENGLKDASETDADCGGSCPPCASGKHCLLASDCATHHCAADTCAACGVGNDCEGATYCAAGTCVPRRANGASCQAAGECASTYCVEGTCCGSATCGSGASCATGTCECVGGMLDCDGAPGCEVDPTTDGNNCGGCGVWCNGSRWYCADAACNDLCNPGACQKLFGCNGSEQCHGGGCGTPC